MVEKLKIPKDVTFQYKVSDNYTLYSMSGAHGGLNASGDVIVNFFSERQPIPKREKYKIQPTGALAPMPIEVEATSDIIRNVSFGIALKPDVARSVGNWLIDKANEHDKLMVVVTKKGKKV